MCGKRVVRSSAACALMSAACIALLLTSGCAAKTARLTAQQRLQNLDSFDHVWTTVRDKHWDPDLNGVDWNAVREELRPRVAQARTMGEARSAMREMLGRLNQTHFGIISAEAYESLSPADDETEGEDTGPRDGATGIDVRVIDGLALVTDVQPDSPAGQAGVSPGWVITRIADEDVESLLENVAQEFAGKTYQNLILARAVEGRLRGPVGDMVEVEFLDESDRAVELTLTLEKPHGKRFQFGHFPPGYVWFESKRLDGNIGYVAFNIFFDPETVMSGFNGAIREFMDADGIVIDLRGNPGGIGAMSMGMAGWLIGEGNRKLGTMYTRENELRFVVFPRPQTYQGPVAILVDGLTGSTAEIFSGGLKDLGRARIFGTCTAGAALPSMIERLPNGDGFQYAIANYISQGGEPLEGVGVVPDVEVRLTREALLAGRDPVLEAAVSWIHEQHTREAAQGSGK